MNQTIDSKLAKWSNPVLWKVDVNHVNWENPESDEIFLIRPVHLFTFWKDKKKDLKRILI